MSCVQMQLKDLKQPNLIPHSRRKRSRRMSADLRRQWAEYDRILDEEYLEKIKDDKLLRSKALQSIFNKR